jgi:hypothetical protein
MKYLILFMTLLICSAAIAEESDTFTESESIDRVIAFCKQEYKREPSLIEACVTSQLRAMHGLESYVRENWSGIGEDHPVMRLLVASSERAGIVVDGKPWVNWSLMKLYFKRSMQTWLEAEGKSDPELDYGL